MFVMAGDRLFIVLPRRAKGRERRREEGNLVFPHRSGQSTRGAAGRRGGRASRGDHEQCLIIFLNNNG